VPGLAHTAAELYLPASLGVRVEAAWPPVVCSGGESRNKIFTTLCFTCAPFCEILFGELLEEKLSKTP